MHDSKVDFTKLFRSLSDIKTNLPVTQISIRNHFLDRDSIDQWLSDYINRLKAELSDDANRKQQMDKVNPKYILRNHLAQFAIEKAQQKDFSEVAKLLKILESPFDEQAQYQYYSGPPPFDLATVEVSCSS